MKSTLPRLALILVLASGCVTQIKVDVTAEQDLNVSPAGPQPVDVYFARVSDLPRFQGANIGYLAQPQAEMAVPGGVALGRFEILPDETQTIDLGEQVEGHDFLGIYAAFRAPASGRDSHIRAIEVPGNGRIRLRLGKNGILAFDDE